MDLSVSLIHRPVYFKQEPPVSTGLESGWAPEPIWIIWRKSKPLTIVGTRTPDRQLYICEQHLLFPSITFLTNTLKLVSSTQDMRLFPYLFLLPMDSLMLTQLLNCGYLTNEHKQKYNIPEYAATKSVFPKCAVLKRILNSSFCYIRKTSNSYCQLYLCKA
jgi:hypothetical protein